MDTFEYLSVLISVVVGLGVVHILQGIGRGISRSRAPKLFWVHSIWVIQSLLYLFNFWWFQLGYRPVEAWSSALFMFILLYAVALYLQCAIVMPLDPRDDYEAYFIEKRRWLYGILLLVTALDSVDSYLKPEGVHVSLPSPLAAAISLGVAVLIFGFGMYTKRKWYHGAVALLFFASTLLQVLGRPEPGG